MSSSSRDSSSSSASSGTSSRSSSGSGDSGRSAVPRGSRGDGDSSSSRREDGHDQGRFAVDRGAGNADRGSRARQSGHSSRHHGGNVVLGGGWWDPWWYGRGPWWGWSWGWGWSSWGPWGPWGPAGVYYDRPYRGGRGSGYGALDTDIWPGDAEIYVDGERLGTADDFDGFPAYLWLPRGTYDVVIYLPGFQTIARQYSIYDGLVIDVDDRMQRGEAIRPEDLPTKTHDRRDERLRNEADMQDRARRREEWRQRQEGGGSSLPAGPGGTTAPSPAPSGGDGAHVHLSVTPGDASVYLDGNFLGTGSELAQLSAGILVPPGSHRLEVVRPGYDAEQLDFRGNPGEELNLEVTLDED